MTYAERQAARHLDGTLIFQTAEDRRNQEEIATLIEKTWECRLAQFGALSPIDWYAERYGRLVGLLELKGRTHPVGQFDTVFLNVRKWLALTLGSFGMGVPAIFVVKFTDDVRWIALAKIDATRHRIAGCAHIVKNQNDIEPVVEILVAEMPRLG